MASHTSDLTGPLSHNPSHTQEKKRRQRRRRSAGREQQEGEAAEARGAVLIPQSVFSHHKLTTTAFVETRNMWAGLWAGLKPGSAAPAQNQVLQSDRARLMHTAQHIQVYPGEH